MSPVLAPLGRISTLVQEQADRYRRRRPKAWGAAEIRQLRGLERAYSKRKGPEVLVLGDSVMAWASRSDADRRRLVTMLRDELPAGTAIHTVAGPGYNPRIVMAYLSALERARSRPRVVVVPAYVSCAMDVWLTHPTLGYALAAEQIREMAKTPGRRRPRRLVPPSSADEEAYDDAPAPSLTGSNRSVAELRLMTTAVPATASQRRARQLHLLDSYTAERLELGGPGPTLVAHMGAELARMGLDSVAYLAPIDHQLNTTVLGPDVYEHIHRNAEILAESFKRGSGGRGTVVNATFDSPSSEFSDTLHLNDAGRRRLASALGAALTPLLLP